MEESLLEAIWLLIVGMGSVFFTLFLIGFLGRILIRWVNTFAEKETFGKYFEHTKTHNISAKQLAVINAAVEEITGGTGCIEHIQKIVS